MGHSTTTPAGTNSSALSPAITREQLQDDLLTIFLYEMRMASFLIGEEGAASGFLRRPLPKDPDLTAGPTDIGLAFADISHSDFVQAFLTMYDYAYFGLLHANAEAMGDETSYTRAAGRVFDLQWATLPEQTLQDEAVGAAERLTQVAETANARHLLEGGHEAFYPFRRRTKGASEYEPDEVSEGELTVRQLALLAGMEEMTIRKLANPKRADALATISRDGRTWIEIATAKAWLQRKGRYLPVRRDWTGARVDLAAAHLRTAADLGDLLDTRLRQLADEGPGGAAALKKRLGKAGVPFTETKRGLFLDLTRANLGDSKLLEALADVLDLPAPVLQLRGREVVARDDLARAERELAALKPAPGR